MHQLVIPRRAGAVVSVVLAAHVDVTGEPARIVIDTVTQAVGSGWTDFATGYDTVAVAPRLDLASARRDVQQQPMKEHDARKRSGHRATFLVDVICAARHVGV